MEVIALLLDRGADHNLSMGTYGPPLCYAVSTFTGDPVHGEVVDLLGKARLLLAYGADVEKTCHGQTPLHRAVERNNLEFAELLLEWGANIEASSSQGTPLFRAVLRRDFSNLAMVEFLLGWGADINTYHEISAGATGSQRRRQGRG